MQDPNQPPQPPGPPPMNPGWSPTQQPAPQYVDHMRQAMPPVPYQQPPAQPYVIPPKKINHGLHLVLTLCTFGMWGFVWLAVAIFSDKKSTIVYPDGRKIRR